MSDEFMAKVVECANGHLQRASEGVSCKSCAEIAEAVEKERKQNKQEISDYRTFAKVMFAHIYAEPIDSEGVFKGDHLSLGNVELIEKVKSHIAKWQWRNEAKQVEVKVKDE